MANATVSQYTLDDLTGIGVTYRAPFQVYTNLGVIAEYPEQEQAQAHFDRLRNGPAHEVLSELKAVHH